MAIYGMVIKMVFLIFASEFYAEMGGMDDLDAVVETVEDVVEWFKNNDIYKEGWVDIVRIAHDKIQYMLTILTNAYEYDYVANLYTNGLYTGEPKNIITKFMSIAGGSLLIRERELNV